MAPDLAERRPLRFALSPAQDEQRLVFTSRALRVELETAFGRPVDVTVSRSFDVLVRNLLSGAVDAAHAPGEVCARASLAGLFVVVQTEPEPGREGEGVIVRDDALVEPVRRALLGMDKAVVAELFGPCRFVSPAG